MRAPNLMLCLGAVHLILMTRLTLQQCFSKNSWAASINDANVDQVLDGSTDFALQLLRGINANTSTTDNVIFSPISIWSALLVAYLGASGQTEAQLASALGIRNWDKVGVANTYHILKDIYSQTNQPNYTLRMANRLYFNVGEPVRDCMSRIFKSDIQKVNFVTNAEAIRLSINSWIEGQTNNKIKDLLPARSVDSLTKMIIVNAAYFKGFWEKPFHPLATRQVDFYITPNSLIKVDFMYQESTYKYASSVSLNCDAIELPYVGEHISMVILLPGTTVENLIPKLSQTSLQSVFRDMIPTMVELYLPKFKTEQAFSLNGVLTNLGIRDMFQAGLADLSGFTGQANSYVQSALHKAFIEVNEEGTEAAAATSLITTYSLKNSETFLVNRPFVFLIKDNVHNAILFAGVIRNPA